MSQALYDSLPEQMKTRIATFNARTDEQSEPLDVVTTLLAQKLVQLVTSANCTGIDGMLNLTSARLSSR